ncbi:MAG: hypothetical protein AB2L11_12220 [Syntrophobacteraceae bacterium]
MDYVGLVMFAVEAATRLGRKAVAVYAEEVRDNELILPHVDVEDPDIPSWSETEKFFANAGRAFVAEEGLYAAWWKSRNVHPQFRDRLCLAHLAIKDNIGPIREADDLDGYLCRNPDKFYASAHALLKVKQWRDGTDPKRHPVQRLAGTMVELAVDYIKLDPTLFGTNGKGDRILRSFLVSLDEVKFAEDDFDDLLVDIARSSLNVFKDQSALVISDDALTPLFSIISGTLAEDLKKIKESNEPDKLLALNRVRREMLEHLISASVATVSGYPDTFPGTSRGEQLLKGVLNAILTATRDHPDLFSSGALSAIYAAGLKAAAENTSLLLPTNEDGVQNFLGSLVTNLARKLADIAITDPQGLFGLEILPELTEIALKVLAKNARTLINPANPEQQLLVSSVEQVSLALSSAFHGNGQLPQIMKSLLSREQLLRLIQEVFETVAQHPEGLLQGVDATPERTPLAQIVGSVAAAVAGDIKNLLNGEGFVKLVGVALHAFSNNPDRLLDLNIRDSKRNIMAQVISSVCLAASKNLEAGGRNILAGENLIEIIDAALSAVSKNTDAFMKEPDTISMVLDRLLFAASHSLANELDAENLLLAFSPILRLALQGKEALDMSDAQLILPHLESS